MSQATFIALGAAALGLVVFAGCLALAVSVRRKKAARESAAPPAN
jgi:hypothetical protein